MPQAAEASRIHSSYPVAAAAWSCLSSEKIRDKKNIHRNNLKLRQKTFPNDVGIAMQKVFKQGVGMAVCKGKGDGIKNIAPRCSSFCKASVCVTLFECPCHGIKHKVRHT